MSPYSYSAATRTYDPFWQQGLRRCVRLYLALDEPGSGALLLEQALRLLERRLRAYLQAGRPRTPATEAEAWGLLDTAQLQWLGDEALCRQLQAEMSVAQALSPAPAVCPPAPLQPGLRLQYPAASRPGWRPRDRQLGKGRAAA